MRTNGHAAVNTVIGAGNGGLALAADIAVKGVPVRLYESPSFADDFAEVTQTRTIETVERAGSQTRRVELELATHDLIAAVSGAKFVHVAIPVSAHEQVFRAIIPLLSEDQILVIWAGRFSALRCKVIREELADAPSFGIIEINTLPYGSRRIGPGKVSLNFYAQILYGAVHSGDMAEDGFLDLQQIFPILKRVETPLEVTFRNSGIPLLGVGAVMNASGIEANSPDFSLFRDGMTPSTRRAIRLTHEEIVAVGRALGFDIPLYPDEVYDGPTSIEGANFRDSQGGVDGFLKLTGPSQLNHRYTVENVRYGLEIVSALGKRHGVTTPFIDAICTICNALCGEEFRRSGWTLADLGI